MTKDICRHQNVCNDVCKPISACDALRYAERAVVLQGRTVQEKVSGHYSDLPARGQEDNAKHDIDIVPGSLLHKVMGRDTMRLCTFHNLNTPPTQTLVSINAWSALGDGVVEGVEYGDNILGVQGHPEADDLLPELFKFLAED